jgi:co-chaperonin GroES (HSP10)
MGVRIEPLFNQVVVQVDLITKEGGIELPHPKRKIWGIVVAIGPGMNRTPAFDGDGDRVPMHVKIGDKVLLSPNATRMIPENPLDPIRGKDVLICQEQMIEAILIEEQLWRSEQQHKVARH